MKILFVILLTFFTITIWAQFTREEAISITIEEVVGADSLSLHHLYSKFEMMHAGDTLWVEYFLDNFIVPFGECWVFFIDDMPPAYWVHPCRYVLFDRITGEYSVIAYEWPPLYYLMNHLLFLQNWEWILETAIRSHTSNLSEWEVFPNPVKDQMKIRISSESVQLSEILLIKQLELFNMQGSVVLEVNDILPTSVIMLNIQCLPAGIYMLAIETDKRFKCVKIIKQ